MGHVFWWLLALGVLFLMASVVASFLHDRRRAGLRARTWPVPRAPHAGAREAVGPGALNVRGVAARLGVRPERVEDLMALPRAAAEIIGEYSSAMSVVVESGQAQPESRLPRPKAVIERALRDGLAVIRDPGERRALEAGLRLLDYFMPDEKIAKDPRERVNYARVRAVIEAIREQESLAREIYARVSASVVDVYGERPGGGGCYHTIGLGVEPHGVTAWSGLLAGTVDETEAFAVRQGGREWSARLHTISAEWGLCALVIGPEFSVPLLGFRRSNTLRMGERLVYAVAGEEAGKPRLGWAELCSVFTISKKSYNRERIWTARFDFGGPLGRSVAREHAFAFDAEGRVAGLLEPLPEIPHLAALLAGEWVGHLVERSWVEFLLSTGGLQQLVEAFRAKPDSYGAESLCAIGLAFLKLGRDQEARQAWELAIAKDPLNPWPHRGVGNLLVTGECLDAERGLTLLARAAEFENGEPAEPEGSRPPREPPGNLLKEPGAPG